MKLSKKKVFALALVICLLATLSLGSLAWFTDEDEVTNDFMVAGSENGSDGIFSVDVTEKSTDPDAKETLNGLQYDKILPGDTLSKIVTVTNTGSYDQYIRVKIEVSHAELWQEIYQANRVPVTEFVDLNVERDDVYGVGSYLVEGEAGEYSTFVYYVYFTEVLAPGKTLPVFENAFVAEELTQDHAVAIGGGFTIKVTADAVQTENVGANVYEAFNNVGMLDETNAVNTQWIENKEEMLKGFEKGGFIILTGDINKMYAANKLVCTEDVELYLNGKTMETAYGTFEQNNYGVVVEGKLTVSGTGTLDIGSLKLYVDAIDVIGANVKGADRIVIAD